jgi:hypothetical protein
MGRRTRHTLPSSKAQVLYAPGNDRASFELRFQNLPYVEASYCIRSKRIEYVSISQHAFSEGASLIDLPTVRMQLLLNRAITEFRETFNV